MKNINWHDGKLWAGLISLLIVLVQQLSSRLAKYCRNH
jgi:hypothetical protein